MKTFPGILKPCLREVSAFLSAELFIRFQFSEQNWFHTLPCQKQQSRLYTGVQKTIQSL